MEPIHVKLSDFINEENLYNIIKSKTCFKKTQGSCIDLILTNRKFSFKNSSTSETGLSDHHHLIYSVMKTSFRNEENKILIYRDFKNFSIERFKIELDPILHSNNNDFKNFEDKFVKVLDKNAPKKTKIFRGNQKPHIDKKLRIEIMKRSRLKNIANKSQNPIDKSNYKKQRNLVVRLNRRCKAEYFNEVMNTSKDTRPFWTACKPYFSNKHSKGDSKIILIENNEIIQDNEKVANIFNSYFESITDSLELFK